MNSKIKCTIVMYHYIRNMYKTDYPNINGLLIKKFKGQLNYILRNYTITSLEDYIKFLNGNENIPNNICILTFDDGFKDHYHNVFPILKKKKLPASFFPLTQPLTEFIVPAVHKTHFLLAKIGPKIFGEEFNKILKTEFPELSKTYYIDNKIKKEKKYRWDNTITANLKWTISAMPSKPKIKILNQIFTNHFENEKEFCKELFMNFDEIKEMIEEGMSFGSHSHSHPMLPQLTREEQIKEIRDSKKLLEKKLKQKIKLFSYPYGGFNKATIDILKEECICGLTVEPGINKGNNINPFTLKRLDTNDLPFK